MKPAGNLKYALWTLFLMLPASIGLVSCSSGTPTGEKKGLQGELIVFHAGSLSVPVHQIADSFEARNPGVKVLLEAAGSKACARMISELKKPCDVFASSDEKVIENLLIPEYASWCIPFAGNEMAIVYSERSKAASRIDSQNWPEVLLQDDVVMARSDPDSDPCGARAVLVMQLAEKYYRKPGLAAKMMKKDTRMIRPKETDLIALLESGVVDYIFLYRSVAVQHGLPYLQLPDSINLNKASLSAFYQTAEIKVRGKNPGEWTTEKGEAMVYGLAIPHDAPHPLLAEAFTRFFLTEGLKIMEANGQPSLVPAPTATYQQIPTSLRSFAKSP